MSTWAIHNEAVSNARSRLRRDHSRVAALGGWLSLGGSLVLAVCLVHILILVEARSVWAWAGLAAIILVTGGVSAFCITRSSSPIARRIGPALIPLWLLWPILEVPAHMYVATQPDLMRVTEFSLDRARFTPHPYLSYFPTPGWSSPTRKEHQHNALGFRGPEVNPDREPGSLRVLLLGGSTTYGEYLENDHETWSAQLESLIGQDHAELKPEVINGGISGSYSTESLISLCLRGIDLAPDVALLYHGCNDAHARFVDPENYLGDGRGFRRVWDLDAATRWRKMHDSRLLRFSAIFRWGVVRMCHRRYSPRTLGPEVFTLRPDQYANHPDDAIDGKPYDRVELAMINPPVYFERNLRSFVGVCRAHRIRPVLATWAYAQFTDDYMATESYRLAVKQQNDVVRRVAEEMNVALVDLAAAGLDAEPSYWIENRHMTAAGTAAKAGFTYEAFQRLGLLRPHERSPTPE